MKIYKTLFALVALLASVQVAAAISIGGYEISSQSTTATNAVACTMDAQLCPDGVTYVGRTGPNCAFAACPAPIPSTCVDLQFNLDVGSVDANTNGEVTKLQNFLHPKYLAVPATGAFYGMTKKAVMKFQGEYGISPAVGFVGTITRAKIKQLTCGGASQVLEISSITPSYAKVGETVTLTGPGLNSGNDYILFDGYRIETTGLDYAGRVSFKVPTSLSHTINCITTPCPDSLVRLVTPGTYSVKVVNTLGTTNTVFLTVTDGTVPPNETIKISWVEPSAAKVGTSVVVYGYNLFRAETRILFDGYSIPGTPVYTKRAGNFNSALQFIVPEYLSPQCNRLKSTDPCPLGLVKQVVPGWYELSVDNKYGRDAVKFEVLGDTVSIKPYLNYVNPPQGVVGTEVSVFGRNLNTGSEKVYFGNSQVFPLTSLYADQKGVVRFKIPEYITPCGYEDNTACRMAARPVTPGKYEIIVKNNNGLSNTVSFTVTGATTAAPKINSLTPSAGLIGTEVVIQGEGINIGGDKIYFGGALVPQSTTASADVINRLQFKIPEYITPCGVGSDGSCKIASRLVTSGNYEVVVVNNNGTSNAQTFLVALTPTITSFTPTQGPNGSLVTVYGTNFLTNAPGIHYLRFIDAQGNVAGPASTITTATSPTTATFTIATNVPAGTYRLQVRVTGNATWSNVSTNTFTVTTQTTSGPVISGVSGPQALNVNQQGTWTVTASNSTGGNLSYSVVWGDEGSTSGASSASTQTTSQQTATFNKSYSQIGTYAPRFTVTNTNGQSASASLSVNVGGTTSQSPIISTISPETTTTGTQVTLTGQRLNTGSPKVLLIIGNNVGVITPSTVQVNDSTLYFTIPSSMPRYCAPGLYCTDDMINVTPGAYTVKVMNSFGTSNAKSINVISYSVESPLITKFQVDTISTGNSITRKLVWTTQFTSSCTASGAWSGTQSTNGSYSIGFMSQPLTYTLTCRNSQGVSVSKSVTEPANNTTQIPVISTISPSFALVGTEIALSGQRLNTGDAKVLLTIGNNVGVITPSAVRVNDSTLLFTIPSMMSRYCSSSIEMACTDDMINVTPGAYTVKVMNSFGTSNDVIYLTVAAPQLSVPSISSLSPAAGATNSQVTISGTNFNPSSDFVWFGGIKFAPTRTTGSSNKLVFNVPGTLSQCNPAPGQECTMVFQPTPPGLHTVKVENSAGVQSNPVNYQVTGDTF